jgi:hypothetical protein
MLTPKPCRNAGLTSPWFLGEIDGRNGAGFRFRTGVCGGGGGLRVRVRVQRATAVADRRCVASISVVPYCIQVTLRLRLTGLLWSLSLVVAALPPSEVRYRAERVLRTACVPVDRISMDDNLHMGFFFLSFFF